METFQDKYMKELQNELSQLLFLCGNEDRKILLAGKVKKDKVDDIARLVSICLVFDYRKAFLKILTDAEKHINAIKKEFDKITFEMLDVWMEDFTANVEYEEARDLVREFWSERKKTLTAKTLQSGAF